MFLPAPAPIGSHDSPSRPRGRRSRARHRAETPRPRWFRGIALALAVLIPASGVALGSTGIAQAAVVQWGSGSDQSPNYQATVNGDFVMAGNGVLACTGSALASTSTAGSCADLHANNPGTGVTASYNDYFSMVNSNTVSGFTTNSSSAQLTIPAGATVSKAFLNWSANTGVFTGSSNITCSANSGNGSQWYATRPDTTSGYRSRSVQLKVGNGAIATVAPSSMLEDPTSQSTALYYSAGADVTSAFSGATTGSALTVSAGNIWAAVGAGCYAGWSLTVVYDYGKYIQGNANSAPHNVIYYEGHVREAATDSPLTVKFSGFSAIDSGAKFGYTLFEGDRGITGDYMKYTPQGGSATDVLNAKGATGNIGIGQADGSVRYTQTSDTSTFTNQSVDVHTETLSGVGKGDTSMTLTVGTSGDSYLLRNAVLSVPTANISVSKTLDGTTNSQYRIASENTAYSITVTNNGSVSLSNIQLTFPDTETCTPSTAIAGPLASGASTTVQCTGPPPTTASTTSSVTATGTVTSDSSLTVSATDTTNVYLSALALTKTAALATGATGKAGDTVNYTFTATNTGTDALTGVSITDPLKGLSALTYGTWPSGVSGALAAGQSVTATATYTLTQTDVDAGSVSNTATTVGTDPDGGPQPTATASRTLPLTAANALTLTKSGALAPGATGKAGDTVNWTFKLTNSGAQTVTGAAISDPGVSAVTYGTWPSGTAGRLAPGQSVTATATSSLTQAQVDAGTATNTAAASGTTAGGAAVAAPSVTAAVAVPAADALALTKTGALASGATGKAGDTVTWSFALKNTGNRTVTGAAITDQLAGVSAITYAWPGTAGTLAPGATVTGTATYALTQTDVDAGSVVNTAGASGRGPTGTTITAPSATATVAVTDASQLTIVKNGALATGATGKAGDTVNWTFTVTNNGNTTLSGVTIADPLSGISSIAYGTWSSGTTGKLLPGGSVTATATSTLTQSQVDAGAITNTATASGSRPSGTAVTSGQATKTVNIAAAQAIALTKTGALASGATGAVGDTVNWSFSARNTGNTTLTGVSIADQLSGVSAITYAWPGTAGTLAPNQVVTGTATYKLTQADVDAGSVVNTAGVTGTNPSGALASSTAAATVAVSRAPGISITKTGALASGATGAVGDTVNWSFSARNTGNTTLTGVSVADQLSGVSAITYAWPGTAGTLAPNQVVTGTATYKLTQADVDAGSVVNTAGVTGTNPSGALASSTAAATVAVSRAPGISITKTGALASGATGAVGDRVTYTFTVKDTGNTTLTGVTVADPLAGLSALTYSWPGTAGRLTAGQTATATATYALTQKDIDAGYVANTATATGSAPDGTTATNAASARVTVPTSPAVTVSKTGALAAGATGVAGDTVNYTFTARNTGNQTLTGVTMSDALAGVSALTYGTWPSGTAGTLAPGQSVTATATYTLTQNDVDAGSVVNTARVAATTPAQTTITNTAPNTLPIASAGGLAFTKTGALATGATGRAGDTVRWTFALRNTGNVTLTGTSIADQLPGLSSITYSWPGTTGRLAPGQTATATATSTLTQAQVDAGTAGNTATATATTPSNTTVTQGASASVPVTRSPGIAVAKSGALAAGSTGAVGDTVTWTLRITDTGTTTLTNVGATDSLAGISGLTFGAWPSGTSGTLAPGQTVTATATSTLTQTDLDAGAVTNTATATGSGPTGTSTVTGQGSGTVPITSSPALSFTKTVATNTGWTGKAGDTLTYTFTARNTGNPTLTGVAIADPHAGLSTLTYAWPGTAGRLTPGQTVTATATYAVTQADVDAGTVANRATVSGVTPQGTSLSTPATASQTIAPAPGIAVAKSAVVGGTGKAGDTVTYRFDVSNTGTTTLTNVGVTDPLTGLSAITYGTWPSGTAGTLAPGQTVRGTATYVLTQADLDAGSVVNTATASGTSPAGAVVSGKGSATVKPATGAPSIGIAKTERLATNATGVAGDTVRLGYTITNTGNQTLTGVTLADAQAGHTAFAYGAWPSGTAGTLAPGQSVTATSTYVLTQADVDAGTIASTATTTGVSPGSVTVRASDTGSVTTTRTPAIALTESGAVTSGTGGTGSVITWTYRATNTGTVTLTGDQVTHSLPGAVTVTWPGAAGTLAPGQSLTATATTTVAQSDVDAGSVVDTSSVTGTAPTGTNPATVTATAAATVTTSAATPGLSISKAETYTDGTTTKAATAGTEVDMTYVVKNTGNVTLTIVGVADAQKGISSVQFNSDDSGITTVTLAPGASARAFASYTLSQSDVDAGGISSVATAFGTAPSGTRVTATASAGVTITPTSTLALTKTARYATNASGAVESGKVGDTVVYTFALQNTGSVTLSNLSLQDALVGLTSATPISGTPVLTNVEWSGGTAGTLAPKERVRANATYTITQADVDRGSVTNDATATGTTPAGATTSGPATVAIATDQANTATIGIAKTAALASTATAKPGDTVNLGYTVTNTGDFTLTGVTLADPGAATNSTAFGTWPSGTTGTLAPGQSVTATATHALTQGDIDAGFVSSTATTRGTPANGGSNVTATAGRSVSITQVNDFTFGKTGAADKAGAVGVGDVIDYTLTATNTGNTTLDLLQMTDQLRGVSVLSYQWPDASKPGTVLPGQSAIATATYTITQNDVDAGSVVNTANAVASPPTGAAVTKTASTSGPALDTAGPAIDLVKTEKLADGSAGVAGDTVQLGYTVTNTGTTTLTGVAVTDPQQNLSGITYAAWPSGTTGTLAPGQSVTATATYTLTQADVDRAAADTAAHTAVGSTATATGVDKRGGGTVRDTDAGAVTLTPTSSVATRKTAAIVGTGNIAAVQVGNVVRYTVTATNTGQTTLTGVAVTDDLAGLGTPTTTWPGTAGTLAPGQAVVVTADRTVTQADVDAGSIVNTATTTGTTPAGTAVSGSGTRTVVATAGAPTIRIVKQEALAAGATGAAGDTVAMTFTVTNTGDVTLSGVTVADGQRRLSGITFDAWPSGTAGTLAPGQSVVAHATYTLRQADVDKGTVASTATTTGTPPRGAVVSDTSDGSVVIAPRGAMTLDKTGALANGATGRVGDTIDYTFTVQNTGNVTVSLLKIQDVLSGMSDITFGDWPTTVGQLAPGQTVTATATYRVTQGDVDAGSVANQATATANTPAGDPITASDAATVPLAATAPAIGLTKTERLADGATGIAGDTVDLGYTITNRGDTTLSGVTLGDAQSGLSSIAYGTWPGQVGVLAPGQSVTASATTTLTQAQVDAGRIASTATTSGVSPKGTTVSDTAQGAVQLTAPAAVGLTKTAAVSGSGAVGDTVRYTFTVTNTGAVTLSAPTIDDRLAGLGTVTVDAGPNGDRTLAPGQSLTATAGYVVSQADVDAGAIVNTATVGATPARGDTVTATASTTTPTASGTPGLGLTKTEQLATTGTHTVGDLVDLGYTVTNTGNQTVTGIALTDDQSGVSAIAFGTWPSGTAGTLAPGQSVTATATYALTQADIDRGTVASGAVTTGTTRSGTALRAADQGSVTITSAPAMAFAKTGALAAGATGKAGESITYDFTVTNTGNVTLSLLQVEDGMPGLSDPSFAAWPGQVGQLAPGQRVEGTASYTIKQSDVDAGSVTNTATATAQAPDGTVISRTATATVETAASGPRIGITKTAELTGAPATGSRVDDTYTITNTGNVTLTGIDRLTGGTLGLADDQPGVTAPVFGAWPGTTGTLAPGQSVTATAHTVLTQAMVDAGSLSGTATTNGTAPNGTVVAATDGATVVLAPNAAMSFAKTASTSTGTNGTDGTANNVGDTVRYTFTATNTGNVTLSGITITDRLVGMSTPTATWPGTAGSLAPGQTVTATATYTITQADVDAGGIVNQATATANPPTGAPVTDTDSATVSTASASDGIALTKDERITSGTGVAGDTVTITYIVTNDGNRTLTGVGVTDDQSALSGIAFGTWPSGTPGTLAPGQSVTATATHRLTQAEVDAGGTASSATATGTTPGGDPVTDTATGSVQSVRTAALALDKRAALGTAANGGPATGTLGDTIDYTYRVTNTGTVTLTGVGVTDVLNGLGTITVASWPSGTAGTLAPGQTVTGTATYTVTQADVDAGSVVNTATANGTAPTGVAAPSAATDSATVALATASQQLRVTKTETLADGASGVAGDTVRLGYEVTNTGTTTLHDVGLSDAQTGVSGIVVRSWPGTAGTLAPGQSVRADATYTLTQADVDRGGVSSPVTATGTAPNGTVVSDGATAGVSLTAHPSIALTESGALAPGATGAVGDTVTWTFTVKNTGDVTLSGTALTQAAGAGATTAVFGTWPGATGVLAPGQVVTATSTSTITQAQFDAGSVTNPATASGTTPAGATVRDDATATVETGPADARIGIVKSAALPDGDTAPKAGDVVTFTYTVTNTGTSTLTGIDVTDTQSRVSAITGEASTLAPGATTTATATYTLTQADIDAGSISSPATATGTPPTGDAVTATSGATLVLPGAPALGVVKTGALRSGDTGAVGDRIDYTVTLANTGTTTLHDVAVTDRLAGIGSFTVADWPTTVGTLAPGQHVDATAAYTVTQDDVDAGQVVNRAIGTANPPTGAPVSGQDAVTVPLRAATPSIDITKTQQLAPGAVGRAGDTVDYTFTVTNTGTATLSGVTVADGQAGIGPISVQWPGATGVLRPGQSATATASYPLTQADVDAGRVASTATTTGTAPNGAVVTDTDTGATTITGTPALSVAKTGAIADGGTGKVGDTVNWTVTVTNTGTVTLRGVTITDSLTGYSATGTDWPGAAGVLAPGQQVVQHGTSRITQAQVDAGGVVNTARATATGPDGTVAGGTGAATVTTPSATPGITITKTATWAPGSTGKAGDTVLFHYVVTNGGDETLKGVRIQDAQVGVSTITYTWPGTPGELAPGQTMTADATYTATQADIDSGAIASPATVIGIAPGGDTVTADANAGVDVPQAPHLSLTKTAALAPGATGEVGDVITWSFRVTNDGNATITDVGIDDELPGLSAITFGAWPTAASGGTGTPGSAGTPGTLQPFQSVTATATSTITQADVDAGAVVNTAVASGAGPDTSVSSDPASAVETLSPHGALTITKTVRYASGSDGGTGQGLVYGFTVVNTGTVTLHDVAVQDGLAGLGTITYGSWPAAPGVLLPGQRVTATADYTVTQADAAAGSVENTATATGRPSPGTLPDDDPIVSTPSTVGITVHTVASGLPGAVLAFTGSTPGIPLGIGALLVLLGLGMAVTADRRRTRKKEHR